VRFDLQHVALRCITSQATGATVLCPLVGPLIARLADRYQTRALLTLALTLAKRDVLQLAGAQIADDGMIDGLPAEVPVGALVAVVDRTLRLCVTRFGEDETSRLIAQAWPGLE
jgi:hypothetical protein